MTNTAWDYSREIDDARSHSTYEEERPDRDECEWLERMAARARGEKS